jgi:hypothetical protein
MLLPTQPAREAIVSWNTRIPDGSLELVVHASNGRISSRLPYVTFSEQERRSHCGRDDLARIDTDVVRTDVDIAGLEVVASTALDTVAVSTPFAPIPSRPPKAPLLLDVPTRSQYIVDKPDERGWCSPATLCMLLAYWGIDLALPDIAARVYDAKYAGTGNWAFNVALAGMLGLRGAVAHLRNLAHAATFIQASIPLALSIAWKSGELPGAPIDHADGHLVALRGFDRQGDPIVNDPAQPAITTTYPHQPFEHAWLAHGGVAYLIAPVERTKQLVRLTNTP